MCSVRGRSEFELTLIRVQPAFWLKPHDGMAHDSCSSIRALETYHHASEVYHGTYVLPGNEANHSRARFGEQPLHASCHKQGPARSAVPGAAERAMPPSGLRDVEVGDFWVFWVVVEGAGFQHPCMS